LDPDGNSVEAVRHEGLRTSPGSVDHLWLRVADARASEAFYAQLAPICEITLRASEPGLVRFRGPQGGSVTFIEGEPRTTGVHFAFPVGTRAAVDAFHAAALEAGGTDNGKPGPRPNYGPHYYAAFVKDPEDNNIEVVCYAPQRRKRTAARRSARKKRR
jgi:catechol 2,3-dioxygenase-like lactoylglutathione lyase family enzyme